MSHRYDRGILYSAHVHAFGTGYFKGTMPKIILDTDPGVDDTLALLLALTSPDIEIVGITTVAGNAPIDLTTANALRLLEAMDISTIPVARGAERPLVRQPSPALTALERAVSLVRIGSRRWRPGRPSSSKRWSAIILTLTSIWSPSGH